MEETRTAQGPNAQRTRTPATPRGSSCKRHDVRLPVSLTSIDPLRHNPSGEDYYVSTERDELVNISRGGLCLRSDHLPRNGDRLLVRLLPPDEDAPIEVVAQTRWTRIHYAPGEHGGRPQAVFGLELVGGRRGALARYERCLRRIESGRRDPLAGGGAVG